MENAVNSEIAKMADVDRETGKHNGDPAACH
jgi:hypothetical protein